MNMYILDRCLEALKPFADRVVYYEGDTHDAVNLSDDYRVTARLGDCRRAAEIVKEWRRPIESPEIEELAKVWKDDDQD